MSAEFLTWFGQWKDVVTVAVALGAIGAVVIQIQQAGHFERDKVRRSRVAARATLPLTLAALSEYGAGMLAAMAPLERWLERREDGPAPAFDGPRLPPETVAAVEKVIAAYPGELVAKALAAILGEVQVLQSRSRDFAISDQNIMMWRVAMKDNVVMAAGIIARCEDLFAFARDGLEAATPSRSHLQQVLSFAGVHREQFPSVWKSLERFAEEEPEIANRSEAWSFAAWLRRRRIGA
ncbi:MAG: hypothetical protein IIZ38_14690 [Sphingomonas sp.]|uniref:hypothetical protein n=1 Tax=Sphingomonas sp. TaxID=28214 RepID=UPI0025ED3A28|nr:hypothetical protein [Sphingomonas sp.]MBQ1499556.1 hypothetical protein [Sphingomonas sp.]MBQ8105698.1 hypothetical protein [Afipia sp.]